MNSRGRRQRGLGDFPRTGRSIALFLALGLALPLLSCGNSGHAGEVGSGTIAADSTIVPVVKVERADLFESVVLTGEFQPYQEVDVLAKVSGYLKTIRVDIGDRVHEGDLLATLEIPEMEDDRKRAEAAVQAAQADVAAAQEELQRSTASHDLAHLSFTRIEDVNKKEPGLVPLQDVDVVHSRDLEAEAQLAASKSKLQAAQEHRQMALAEQARTETLFNYSRIVAPFTGVVTKRYANIGSMIQAGTTSETQSMPVIRLSQNNLLRFILPAPESVVPLIHDGEIVQVNVRSLGRTIPGKVTRFSKSVDMSTRTMATEVDIPNPDLVLVPGLYAEVVLHTHDRPHTLTVPLDAIEGSGDSARAYVVDAAGAIHVVPVKIGVQTAQRLEVLTGLKEGDAVIVGRHTDLHEGQRVQAKPAAFEKNPPEQAGN